MKTTKYISVILLFLIISCTNDSGFDLIEIPTIEPKFGVNTYATINDYKTVEGIELEVNTTKELRLMHGNPENITDEVDGLITWQYLSDGIGFEVNASTDIIEKVYLYTTLYQDYANNYIYQIQEDLAGILLGTMKITQVVDNIDSTIIPVNGTIQEATGGEVNGVYYYDYEGIGRFIYISDSIDNKEGFVAQIIIGAVDAVVVDYPEISFDAAGNDSQTFNVGKQDTDDLNSDVITVGGTGVLVENNGFIGVATTDATDNGATAAFTFDLTTDSATAINATLNLELAKRAKGSVTGTVSVTGYPDTPFSYAATSTIDGGSSPANDFEFASTISLVSGVPLTVTITLDEMLTEGNTTTPIFKFSKVTIKKDGNAPVAPTLDTWLDTDNSIAEVSLSTDCTDCSVSTVTNPDTADTEATNVTKWTIASTSGSGNKSLAFNFKNGEEIALADYTKLIVTVRMYWPSFNDISNYDSNKRFRLYLSDGTNSQQVQINLVESNEAGWHTVEFDFSALTSTLEGDVVSGEFRLIGNKFTNIDNGLEFYIDTITSNL